MGLPLVPIMTIAYAVGAFKYVITRISTADPNCAQIQHPSEVASIGELRLLRYRFWSGFNRTTFEDSKKAQLTALWPLLMATS